MARADRAHDSLAQVLVDRFPDEASGILDATPVAELVAMLEGEPPRRAGELLRRLAADRAAEVVAGMKPEAAARVLAVYPPHRGATLLAQLDPEAREERLTLLPSTVAEDLRTLLAYPADSAGGLMDPRVTAARPETPVRDLLKRLRSLRARRIQDVFLTDAEGLLVGSVVLQDLVLASPGQRLEELVRGPTPQVEVTAAREEVMERLAGQPGSLPVVDYAGRLLGVLRQRELLEAAQQEATADLLTMVGASKDERALSSPLFAIRKRLPWLQINLGTAFLAAAVVGLFEDTIARFTALAVLLPVVAGQSGNTGAQALAVTMRGLALREVRTTHWLRVAIKETAVGLGNGLAVALTCTAAVWLWSRSDGLALVIAVSMVISMMMAGLAGALIPMILTRLRQDPAQSSSIILTTVTDVAGFLSFLGTATLLASRL